MPLSPWDVASLPPAEAGLYVGAMVQLPALPADLAAVVATLATLPPAPWIDRPDPIQVIPGVVLSLGGAVRIPYVPTSGGPLRVYGLAVLHGEPPDVLLGWTPLIAPLLLSSPAEVLAASLSLVVVRPSE